jgi:hypothetical protein
MFEYDLTGKHVLLSLDEEFLPYVKLYGIEGSPLFALVHKMEPNGMWLETKSFKLCPRGIPQIYDAAGEPHCRAHIFIPQNAIISAVAFPMDVPEFREDPELYHIGFRPRKKKGKGTHSK